MSHYKLRNRWDFKITSSFFWAGQLFFFLMLVIPVTYQAERGVLLVFLTAGAIVYALRGNWLLRRDIHHLGLLCLVASLFFMYKGFLNDAPGALRVGSVYIVWPILYLFFCGLLHRPEQLLPFMKTLLVGSICASMMAILMVVEDLGFISLGLQDMLGFQGSVVDIREGTIRYSLYNMSTVIFALPFLLASLMLPQQHSQFKGAWRSCAWYGFILSIVVLLVSGRKAFWVIASLSPFIVIVLMRLSDIQVRVSDLIIKFLSVLFFIVLSFFVFDLTIDAIWEMIQLGFDFLDYNSPAYARGEQYFALINGWLEHPLLGAGHGSAAGIIRGGEDQPWAYELSYLALLFHTGIVGFCIYGSAIAYLFIKGIGVARRQPESVKLLIPLFSGLTCFLIANATNPYLEKFDYLWTIFLPVAVLNAYLLKHPRLT